MPVPIASEVVEDFSRRLQAHPESELDAFVETELLVGVPHIFTSPEEWVQFQSHMTTELRLTNPTSAVLIVGSAMKGFSLAPDRYFQPFGDSSDIDVAVVDAELFDTAWHIMLGWDYLTFRNRSGPEGQWLAQRRVETWSGWYDPTRWHREANIDLSFPEALKPLRTMGSDWFARFQSLARYKHPEVPRHRVSARLYRTHDHLARYQALALRLIQHRLSEGGTHAV